MALIKSTLLAQISGSLNGATFSHNKGGAYVRNRSLPANPGTDRQDQVRTAMTSLSKMWSQSLTDDQRELWRAFGGQVTVLNRIGDPISLSGIAAFTRVNMFRMASLGSAPVLLPPAGGTGSEDPIPAWESSTILNDGVDITLETQATSDATGYGLFVYLSPPLSPGVKFYRGPWAARTTATTPASAVISTKLPASYTPGMYVASKQILFEISTSLKVWEVFTDPAVVPPSP